MVPGAAPAGLVGPIIERTKAVTLGPSQTIATTGDDVMNSITAAKKGRSRCSA
jgi:hypothetical protein